MDDIPRYVARPLQGFLDYQKESMRLLHMSMGGIRMITSVPHSLEVLGEDQYSANRPGIPRSGRKNSCESLNRRKSKRDSQKMNATEDSRCYILMR